MTEYGPLTGYLEIRAKSDNNHGTNNANPLVAGTRLAYLNSAWLELGMLLVGRTGSVYDYGGGFTFDGSDYNSDDGADQVRLSWAMSGFGVQLAIEDPRDKWGTSLSSTYSMPNIVGNISMSQGHWDGKISAGFAETGFGSGFGVQAAATFKLDSIAPGDQLRLKAAWAQNQVWKYAASSGAAGARLVACGAPWRRSSISGRRLCRPRSRSTTTTRAVLRLRGVASNKSAYQIYGNLVWSPVTGFYAGIEGGYTKVSTTSGAWSAKIRLKRSW